MARARVDLDVRFVGVRAPARAGMAIAGAAIGVMLLGGCAGGAGGSGGGGSSQQPEPAIMLSAVERSELRERAATLLADMAMDQDPAIRANAIESLTRAPARLRTVLPVALEDANPAVRSVAAMAAGQTDRCEVGAQLRGMLTDSSPFVRSSAAFALARCGEAVDLAELATLLLTDPSPRLRAHASYLLGELGDASAVPMLLDAAAQPLPRATDIEARLLQIQIAEALVKLGDRAQSHTLYTALYAFRAEELEATVLAVQILGELGLRESISNLNNLLAFRDERGGTMPPEVQLITARALMRLGARGEPPYVQVGRVRADSPDPGLRALAAHVLGESRLDADLVRLRRLLQDPDPFVQVAAGAGVLQATR